MRASPLAACLSSARRRPVSTAARDQHARGIRPGPGSLAGLQKQRYGRIVIAASSALYGMAASIPYSTAKASYIGFTRALAAEGAARASR